MYFNSSYVSNSDLKELMARYEGREKPKNIQDIYDFGTEFHAGILEPHKADLSKLSEDEQLLIKEMSKTFWADSMCQQIAMMPDFRREHEYYRKSRFGVEARCKMDGNSRRLKIILELKGLSVTSEKQFKESIEHLGYDQGACWYLNVGSSPSFKYDYKLIAGISKKEPDRMFKQLIAWDHEFYKTGLVKVKKGISLWNMLMA